MDGWTDIFTSTAYNIQELSNILVCVCVCVSAPVCSLARRRMGNWSHSTIILILGTDFVLAACSGCLTQGYTAGRDQTKVWERHILSGHWRWQKWVKLPGIKPIPNMATPERQYVSAHAPNYVRLLCAARCVVSCRTLRVSQLLHWPIYRLSEHGIGIRFLAKALRPVCLLSMHGLDTLGDTNVMTRGCSPMYTCILFLG